MKQIVIEDKKYDIDCNAWTYVLHKKLFNKGIMQDIHILQNYVITQTIKASELKQKLPDLTEEQINEQVSKFMNEYIDDFIESITRIAYTLICTANEKMITYEEFLKGIKNFKIDDDWIVEVTEIAVDCFC